MNKQSGKRQSPVALQFRRAHDAALRKLRNQFGADIRTGLRVGPLPVDLAYAMQTVSIE